MVLRRHCVCCPQIMPHSIRFWEGYQVRFRLRCVRTEAHSTSRRKHYVGDTLPLAERVSPRSVVLHCSVGRTDDEDPVVHTSDGSTSFLPGCSQGESTLTTEKKARMETAAQCCSSSLHYNMAVVTMKQLLDAGAHFGHQTRRWNPKMKRFIFTERNGIYIIDLQQTLTYIDEAYDFVKQTVAHGGNVLFVGTKKQAQEAIEEEAKRVGMPYVNHRWLGGMLTNFQTVHKRLLRLKELENMEQTGGFEGRTKKEILMLTREKTKLERSLGGIRDMTKVPSVMWVVDTNKEHLAIAEAKKLNIPVVGILDTNCDPDDVDYPIPANDDAIRSDAILTKVIASAIAEGLQARAEQAAKNDAADKPGEGEPLAEWEAEQLAAAAADAPAEDSAAAEAPAADAAADAE